MIPEIHSKQETFSINHASIRVALAYAFVLFLLPTALFALDRSSGDAMREDIHEQICAVFDAPRCTSADDEVEEDTPQGDVSADGDMSNDTGGSENGGDDSAGGGSGSNVDGSTGGPSSSSDTVPRGSVAVVVRSGDTVVRELYSLPTSGSATVSVTSTDKKHAVTVSAHSALVAVGATDDASSAFAVTDLVYYPSFSSFFLNCLTIAGIGEQCGQWQYSVNGSYPSSGLDAYRLGRCRHDVSEPHGLPDRGRVLVRGREGVHALWRPAGALLTAPLATHRESLRGA
jgi:hypothetical protein